MPGRMTKGCDRLTRADSRARDSSECASAWGGYTAERMTLVSRKMRSPGAFDVMILTRAFAWQAGLRESSALRRDPHEASGTGPTTDCGARGLRASPRRGNP